MNRFKIVLFSLLCIAIQPLVSQNSLNFDGVDDRVNCGNGSSLQFSGSNFSVEAWVYPTYFSTYVYENTVVVKEDNSNDAGFMLRTGEGGKLNFALGDGSGGWNELTSASAVLSLNQWQHIAGTYDGSYMRIFVDGKQIDSLSYTGTLGKNGVDMTIGDHNSYSRPFYGQIDEVRVWDAYRTPKQIYDNYKLEFCTAQKGLAAYYKFNQGTAGGSNSTVTSLTDFSGNKNTGTLENFALTGSGSNWVKGASLSVGYSITGMSVSRCNSYTSPSKKYTWTSSGNYSDTVKNIMDCDSILRIYLTINKSTSSILNVTACKSYTSPSKKYTWTKSGKYYDRLTNSKGCDSNITINLTFNYTTTNIKITACNNYVSPTGKHNTFFSGTITDTLSDRKGCDSILIIDVTILNSTYASLKSISCKPLRSPSGKFIMSNTGTYTDTIKNKSGCDSIIEIQFKLLSSNATIALKACGPIKSPSGKYTYTKTGIYKDTLVNKSGCDSALTLNVSIGKATSASIAVSACKSYQVPSRKRTLYTPGVYTDTILNKSGCDSILQITLTFLTTQANINTTACKSMLSPSGKYRYNSSGTYTDTIKNKRGCDSIIQINLTIWKPNTTIQQDGGNLIATATGVTYQWLDCDKAKSKVQGETAQKFVCWQNGKYTVEITENGCKDTGNCITVTNASAKNIVSNKLVIYPNPSSGVVLLSGIEGIKNTTIQISGMDGKVVKQFAFGPTSIMNLNIRDIMPGTYTLKAFQEGRIFTEKLILIP